MAGGSAQAIAAFVKGKDGEVVQVSPDNPLPVTGGGGGTSGGLTDTQLRAAPLDIDPADVQAGLEAGLKSGTGTASKVDSQTAAIDLAAANTARKGMTITNTDANALYVLLSGAGAPSATNFSAIVAGNNGYYEVPYGYTGRVQGAWAADGAGSAFVTQFS